MTEIVAATEAQVVDAVRSAREAKAPLEVIGAGSKRAFGRPTNCDTTLNVSGLRGIVDYRPEELIITVKPGTFVVEITAALAAKNQRLGFDPPDLGYLFGAPENIGTIGGAISCDLNGAASLRFGRVRDHLLGIRAVNGFGQAFKAGGKVVKNVTGFDIPKLVCGAFGTLCVLTEVTLRVFPMQPHVAIFVAAGLPPEEALALLRRVWSSALEPTELSCSPAGAVIRLEGSAAALDEKRAALRALLSAQDVQEVSSSDRFPHLDAPDADIWRISVPPSRAAALIRELDPLQWKADCTGGLLWIALKHAIDVHPIAASFDAHAVLVRGGAETREPVSPFPPLPPQRLALTRSVKAAFDPLGLFNPGRMYSGI